MAERWVYRSLNWRYVDILVRVFRKGKVCLSKLRIDNTHGYFRWRRKRAADRVSMVVRSFIVSAPFSSQSIEHEVNSPARFFFDSLKDVDDFVLFYPICQAFCTSGKTASSHACNASEILVSWGAVPRGLCIPVFDMRDNATQQMGMMHLQLMHLLRHLWI